RQTGLGQSPAKGGRQPRPPRRTAGTVREGAGTMTEPDAGGASDLASISTENELRIAVLGLLGDSYDRAVERRTGLSTTTVNDLRNGRRRLTVKTLTLIVDAYDPTRRDQWLAAWRRVRARGAPAAASQDAEAEPTAHPGGSSSVDEVGQVGQVDDVDAGT